MRRLLSAGLLLLAANGLRADIPSNLRLTVLATPSGIIDTRYRDGDDGTTAIPLSWGTCPDISLLTSDTQSINLRTSCNLIEPGGPDATLSLLSGTLPTGCSIATDGISCTTPSAHSASIRIRATRSGFTADTSAFNISVSASPAGDVTAPPIPTGLTASAGESNVGLSWKASCDNYVSEAASGTDNYDVRNGASTLGTVTTSVCQTGALTQSIIGASDGTTASTQSANDWDLSFAGAGLLSTSDNILMRARSFTEDFTAVGKITAYASASATGSIGLTARAGTAAGDQALYCRWRDSDNTASLRYRTASGGAAATGPVTSALSFPVWVRLSRSADVFSCAYSTDGITFTHVASQTAALPSAVTVGAYITSGTAATNATGTVAQLNITQQSDVTYVATTCADGCTVRSRDVANNNSSYSGSVTAAPSGGGGGALVTVPAATHTVCTTGCDYTPSQLATVAISQRAPDDVLELRTMTAGATEEWATRISCNAVSGTSSAPIWVAVRSGDKIRFDTSTSAGVGLIDLTDCDYWNFVGSRDGTEEGLELGDPSYHQPSCAQVGGSTYGCYPHSRTIMVRSSTGVAFAGLKIHGAKEHDSNIFDKDSAKILIKYAELSYDGHNAYNATSTTLAGKTSDSKDLGHNCATNTVMVDTYSHHYGHTPLLSCGPYQVYRRTTWDGNWRDDTLTAEYTGNHSATFVPGNARSDYNTTTRFGPLIEDSLFYGAGSEPEHKTHNESVQLLGVNAIFRENYIVQRAGTGNWGWFAPQAMALCGSSQASTSLRMAYVHGYHNTVWGAQVTNNSGSIGGVTTGHPADQCAGFKFKNNLFQGMQDGRLTSTAYAVHFQAPAAYTGYSNGWKGAEWFGNIFGQHPTLPSSYYQVRLNVSTGGSGSGTAALTDGVDANGDYDCADAGDSGTWPSNWCGNASSALTWSNSTTTPISNGITDAMPDPETLRSVLTLSGSSSIGLSDAWPLTTTTDAGTTDTTLTLASARYFYDGWDNEDYTWGGMHTEYPDCICVGPASSSTVAQCVVTQIQADSINYSTGAITVSPGVTHVDGSRVWKAKVNSNGSCGAVVDNRGAAQ